MRRAELRRRARAAVGLRRRCKVLCLACGWQDEVDYARPAERWVCPECGRREMVRDDDEDERPQVAEPMEGEA